ncbi:MAG: DUF4166 domain-containing protein [Pseudomonadota bacterium]|nr:DUF4166 domain-containing protein [Pseudomonadota bacterium]
MEQPIADMRIRPAKRFAPFAPVQRRVPSAPYDPRFRRLIGAGWSSLPEPVRRRFSKRVVDDRVVIYRGVIREARFSIAGWLFAQACRIVGAPLPLGREKGLPAAVSVMEDREGRGQFWTRTYARKRGFPQVIHSAKRFAGPTGLEERIGFGIGMALKVSAIDDGIEFRSDHYFIAVAGRRLRLPDWMTPGETVVKHCHVDDDSFVFSLQLKHRWLGELVYQEGLFHDA